MDTHEYRPDEIKVNVTGNLLTVEAKHEEKGEGKYVARQFSRKYTLPEGCQVPVLLVFASLHLNRKFAPVVVLRGQDFFHMTLITSTRSSSRASISNMLMCLGDQLRALWIEKLHLWSLLKSEGKTPCS